MSSEHELIATDAALIRHIRALHAGTPGADRPDHCTWERIRQSTRPEDAKGDTPMHAVPSMPIPKSARTIARESRLRVHQPAHREWMWSAAAVAATVVILVGTFAWQFGLPNDGGRQDKAPTFLAAVLPSSPVASPVAGPFTCDVKPLTVDEIVLIVRNPAHAIWGGIDPQGRQEYGDLLVPVPGIDLPGTKSLTEPTSVPTEADFVSASAILNSYLACMWHGTVGQILNFVDPITIQKITFSNLPVFRTEDDVRALFEKVIDWPATRFPTTLLIVPDGDIDRTSETQRANPSRSEAQILMDDSSQDSNSTYAQPNYMYMGTEILSGDNTLIARSTWIGQSQLSPGQDSRFAEHYVLVRYARNLPWFVTVMY